MDQGDVKAADVHVVLTPATPSAQSIKTLKRQYINRAKRRRVAESQQHDATCCSGAKEYGADYGVGVCLHLQMLMWLRWSFLWLILAAVPFMVVIGTSVFTTSSQRDSDKLGVKIYERYSIYSTMFAAIVDDTVDNGTLTWVNTFVARSWQGPMPKSDFLIWISLLDAGAILVFALGLALLARHLRRLAKRVDQETLEVSDYTVLVRGLPPDVDAAQVGEHFSVYGEVMDVVLITDRLAATLKTCDTALNLKQKRSMIVKESRVVREGNHLKHIERVDKKLAGLEGKVAQQVENRPVHVRAAFVTFNSENERRACVRRCPNSWLSSFLQPRADRFRGSRRFWVRHAGAPEDYRLENLAVSEAGLIVREVLIYIILLLMVLVGAAAIAKLTDISNQERSHLSWYPDALRQDTMNGLAAPAYRSASEFYLSPVLHGPSVTMSAGAVAPPSSTGGGANGTNSTGPSNATSVAERVALACTDALVNMCADVMQVKYGRVVDMAYSKPLAWANTTSRLLYQRPVRAALQGCVTDAWGGIGQEDCKLQACLPCLCTGWADAIKLQTSAGAGASSTVAAEAQSYCGAYLDGFDLKSWVIRLSISLVVAVLNYAIKWALKGLLVVLGKHWTHTAMERSYALQCCAAMLVNTVAVLLLVNSSALGRLAQASDKAAWMRHFVRHGQFSDFTREWYENVGLSILVVMIIYTVWPLLDILADELWILMLRCRVLYCARWPLQSEYDDAWSRPPFTLEQRTADLLLNVSLALLFGSGMPLCYLVLTVYLVVAEACDRWALTRLCGKVPRYGKGLSRLVMGILPWMAVAHCAFALWMHTYFKVRLSGEETSLASAFDSVNAALGEVGSLRDYSIWRRITQANGLALLLLFILFTAWLVLGRYLLWGLTALLGSCCRRFCCPKAQQWTKGKLAEDVAQQVAAVSYGDALQRGLLYGALTYRLKHHPHYARYFTTASMDTTADVTATLFTAACGGPERRIFTRLKSTRPGGSFAGCTQFDVLQNPLTTAVSLVTAESYWSPEASQYPAFSNDTIREGGISADGAGAPGARAPETLVVGARRDAASAAVPHGGHAARGESGDAPGPLLGPGPHSDAVAAPAQVGHMVRGPGPSEHGQHAQGFLPRMRSHGRRRQPDGQVLLPLELSRSTGRNQLGRGRDGRAALAAQPDEASVEVGDQVAAQTGVEHHGLG